MHTTPKQSQIAAAKSALVATLAGYNARPLPHTASSADVESTIKPLDALLAAVCDLVSAQVADIAASVGGCTIDATDFCNRIEDLAGDLFADIQGAAEQAQRNARDDAEYRPAVMPRRFAGQSVRV